MNPAAPPLADPTTPRARPSSAVFAAFAWFITANKRIARRLKPYLSPSDVEIHHRYDELVADHARKAPTPLIVDVGGGKHCSFAHLLDRRAVRIVGVDVSADELAHNVDVDETRVADVTKEMPFAAGEVGLVVSRTLMEHLPDNDAFIANLSGVLAPGGYTIHLMPGRYSLFALAGRAIPFPIAKRILHALRPEMKGIIEFDVYYDRCSWTALHATFRRHGLEVVSMDVSYSQADYFDAFVPAYVACGLYEAILSRLGARQLAAYYLVVARKS
jgi:SAM-dependent methyltransferase